MAKDTGKDTYLRDLKSDMKSYERELEQLGKRTEENRDEWDKTSRTIRRLTEAIKEFQTSAKAFNITLSENNKTIKEFKKRNEELAKEEKILTAVITTSKMNDTAAVESAKKRLEVVRNERLENEATINAAQLSKKSILKINKQQQEQDKKYLVDAKEKLKTEKNRYDLAVKNGKVSKEELALLKANCESQQQYIDDLQASIDAYDQFNEATAKPTFRSAITDWKDNIKDSFTDDMDNISFDSVTDGLLSIAQSIGNAILQPLENAINSATGTLSSFYNNVGANVRGTSYTAKSMVEDVQSTIGINRFLKMDDYLNQIATFASQGVTFNMEERAMLASLSDKVAPQFDAMNSSLLQLNRFFRHDYTAAFMGIEAQFIEDLNELYQDTSYLQGLYDSVNSAMVDALATMHLSGEDDPTSFVYAVNKWTAAIYEEGGTDGFVNQLASAINSLGTGDVTSLAGNSQMQKLVLLGMDQIGMNYADVMQNGLDADSASSLLSAIISYLKEIVESAGDNNVLLSAYNNMFGISMSDLAAIKNISVESVENEAVFSNEASAINKTYSLLASEALKETTSVSDMWDNMQNNALFEWGSQVANSESMYNTWKVGGMLSSIGTSLAATELPGLKTIGKVAGVAGLVAQLGVGGVSLIEALSDVGQSVTEGGLTSFQNSGRTMTGGTTTSGSDISTLASLLTSMNSGTGTSSNGNSAFTVSASSAAANTESIQADVNNSTDEEDPASDIKDILLKVINDPEGGYAINVRLSDTTDKFLDNVETIISKLGEAMSGQSDLITWSETVSNVSQKQE